MSIPSSLQSTLDLLRATFPEGIGESNEPPLIAVLYEHFSDRNLSMVLSEFTGKNSAVLQNEIYRVMQNRPTDAAIAAVKARLEAHGFSDWLKEEQ